jgi:hypothetical protein
MISEIKKYFGDGHGSFKNIEQFEKPFQRAKAKCSALEAEHRLVKQGYTDFPSLLSIVFEEKLNHPFRSPYNRIRDIVCSEKAVTGPLTNEKLCSCLQRMVLSMIKAESARERREDVTAH